MSEPSTYSNHFPSPLTSLSMMDLNFTARKPPHTSARMDIEHMPEAPHRSYHHRRSHSDTSFRFANFDDLLLFDSPDIDLSSALPSPSPSPSPTPSGARMAVDSFNSKSPEDASTTKPRAANGNSASFFNSHYRSLSMDSDFFEGLGMAGDGSDGEILGGRVTAGEKKIARHRHSNSMDGSLTSSFEVDSSKKAMAPDKLAELALMDPKRAKRILANRQSAARSKERKIRYTNELEKKVQMLQSEATSLSAQVTVLQRDTTGLTTENRELKLRLQAMEQQAHLRDALNETLREEVQRLKIAAAQLPVANGNSFNMGGGLPPQFPPLQTSFLQFGNSQNHQQPQLLHMSQPDARGGSPPSQLPGA
uniref:BZIP domain-containing protein n=1 Tax=Cucumis sativus TaxID=3659 RepID=A0A0A0KBC6_CUCSA